MNIEYKSTGTLFDEFYTCDMKAKRWPENEEVQERRHELGNAVQARLHRFLEKFPLDEMMAKSREIWAVAHELQIVLEQCWDAQEVVMRAPLMDLETYGDTYALAVAAITAQRTNAERNVLIRRLDSLLGETENTQLRKTYA